MKKANFLLLIAVISIWQACNTGSNDSVDNATVANESKDSETMAKKDTAMALSTMPVDKDAAVFAVEAANGGMMEVELGKYAQQNAMSQRVKGFGAMMLKDHSKANEALTTIAASKNITLPAMVGDKAKKHMDDMMKMKGKDFDKAYMSMMLDDHKNDIKAFDKAVKECKDAEIKSFAATTLPILMIHLDSAKAISGKN